MSWKRIVLTARVVKAATSNKDRRPLMETLLSLAFLFHLHKTSLSTHTGGGGWRGEFGKSSSVNTCVGGVAPVTRESTTPTGYFLGLNSAHLSSSLRTPVILRPRTLLFLRAVMQSHRKTKHGVPSSRMHLTSHKPLLQPPISQAHPVSGRATPKP